MNPRRFRKIKDVLDRRQPGLAVVMENVHKGHNFAAVLRTCDAVGVFEAHAVTPEGKPLKHRRTSAGGSKRWVELETHATVEDPVRQLKSRGFRILAAHLTERAVDFRAVDWTQPTALLLGQEKWGVSPDAEALCDGEVIIPMVGMVASLNVSVAAAVVLYEAQRQRQAAGCYDAPRLDQETYRRTLFEWAYPRFARMCRERGEPYPDLGEEGQLLGPLPR
ncbi:MAG: tRNA (guanosine(18)-2'-O)-methyltransferase TrmH [Acidobacteria bacterium]|nr:tRNA (guanosine(18)-2'-O)-methyltransferase TrmH [Acidobacteriota bacterium]